MNERLISVEVCRECTFCGGDSFDQLHEGSLDSWACTSCGGLTSSPTVEIMVPEKDEKNRDKCREEFLERIEISFGKRYKNHACNLFNWHAKSNHQMGETLLFKSIWYLVSRIALKHVPLITLVDDNTPIDVLSKSVVRLMRASGVKVNGLNVAVKDTRVMLNPPRPNLEDVDETQGKKLLLNTVTSSDELVVATAVAAVKLVKTK